MVNLVETRALLRGAAIAVMLGGLAGCTGNADAGPSPTTATAGPTGSASPETLPEKPQRPAAMDRDDAKGAAAAAEYFIELYPYVMATGDTEEFEGMSHEACEYCTGALENAEWLHQNDGIFKGGKTHGQIVETYERDDLTGIYPIDVRTEQDELWIVDADGSEVDHVEKSEFTARVEVAHENRMWIVIEVATDLEIAP